MRPAGAVLQPLQAPVLIPAQPPVVAVAADAVIPARGRGVAAGLLLRIPQHARRYRARRSSSRSVIPGRGPMKTGCPGDRAAPAWCADRSHASQPALTQP